MGAEFFKEKIKKIFTEKQSILDIGGGLRVVKEKGNKYDPTREWIRPYIEKVAYKVMDPVPDYDPDIVGDIHAIPFPDASQEAIICIAVLEHVEDPFLAMREMYRTLKPGGYLYIYVPFLFYYHAEKGYYKDYWRFSKDALELLTKDFSHVEISQADGAIGTLIRLSPLGRFKLFRSFGVFLDKIMGKSVTKQTTGYSVFAIK